MAKIKPAKGRQKPSPAAGLGRGLPCLILILGGMLLFYFVFTAALRSSRP